MKKKVSLLYIIPAVIMIFLLSCPQHPDNGLPPVNEPTPGASYALTIENDGNGSSAPAGLINIDINDPTKNISANPDSCYRFREWMVESGDAAVENPYSVFTTVTLSSDATIRAFFELLQYSLTVTSGEGGSVTEPSESTVIVDCGEGTTLTALQEEEYNFVGWTITAGNAHIEDENAATTTVILNSGDAAIEANFSMCSVAPTEAEAHPATICPGGSAELCVVDGILGADAEWVWYMENCGGMHVGTGESITVSPGVTTTYYVRAEGRGETTSCASVTVTVNTKSTVPCAAATASTICPIIPVTLSVVEGSLGTGASWVWYEGSCGSNFLGTGQAIAITPTSTTTYYVRGEGLCNTTDCGSVTVQVLSLSIPPDNINVNTQSVCAGGSTELRVLGGSLGTNARWVWYEGNCGGTSIGTGTSITVRPLDATTYYVRAEGTCNTSDSLRCASRSISISTVTLTVSSDKEWINSMHIDDCYYVSGGNVSPESASIRCGLDQVTVTADNSLTAHCFLITSEEVYFDRWKVVSGSGVIIEDENSPQTTVTLTNGDAHIQAIYWEDL